MDQVARFGLFMGDLQKVVVVVSGLTEPGSGWFPV